MARDELHQYVCQLLQMLSNVSECKHSGHHTCPLQQSTGFHSQKPASLAPISLASWRLEVAEVSKEKGIIIALYQHSPDSGEIRAAWIQGSRKQISLYLSKWSEMVRIDMALSFVNLSALLSLSSPNVIPIHFPQNPIHPATSALLWRTSIFSFWENSQELFTGTLQNWAPYFGKIKLDSLNLLNLNTGFS